MPFQDGLLLKIYLRIISKRYAELAYEYTTRCMPLLRLKFHRMNMCDVVLCHGWGQTEEGEGSKEGREAREGG